MKVITIKAVCAVLLCMFSGNLSAQHIYTIQTDKKSYEYKEPIQVTVSYENQTDSTVCMSMICKSTIITVDTLRINIQSGCIVSYGDPYRFHPGDFFEYRFELYPWEQGLPASDDFFITTTTDVSSEDHEYYYQNFLTDSVAVKGEAVTGGRIFIIWEENSTEDDKQLVRNRYTEFIEDSSSTFTYRDSWLLKGIHPDTVNAQLDTTEAVRLTFNDIHETLIGEFTQYFQATNLEDDVHPSEQPRSFKLSKAYPNPFNPSTTLELKVETHQRIEVNLYTINGQKVASLLSGDFASGERKVIRINGDQLASGQYNVTARGEQGVFLRHITLIK